ncbi:hypothetical protein CFBP498_18290 [Xanthomonas hortorum pv. vitians]|uniref:Uncharacterized protein n=1 Tax=Xanthomonas hortorum pv. vitians TaxID=83224 RepID=A0A6V7CZW2_9XANT|nr:hypothetical protein NCPPB940_11240 [Xanthomonas hortorum pv. taraxaci]CAD0324957.1 hypothetical protein CFBP498_18290 [Xanthomonas hortorum pv. vitians]CAD0347766.1 hypothetical protein CFBP2044_33180 [Xanthomonas hortorum pv. cynarae]CAH2707305.1 hypothetical protein NCPPB1935_05900 [Xanthomonas campestris pv. nigromaculans]CAD0312649.1 hypothetical protein NCPPB940_11240 [Xanthomonas hortorum pv. taraxaci]
MQMSDSGNAHPMAAQPFYGCGRTMPEMPTLAAT